MNKYFVVIFVALLVVCSSEAFRAKREDCAIMCPANYDPVCGFNGNCYKQFGNECMIKVHNCQTRQDVQRVELEKCDDPKTRCPDE